MPFEIVCVSWVWTVETLVMREEAYKSCVNYRRAIEEVSGEYNDEQKFTVLVGMVYL